MKTAAVITVSDKGFAGLRVDTAGPAVCDILREKGWEILHTAIVPDELEIIAWELRHCCDELRANLVLTTGGTGFSPRDITPEATGTVVERFTPGIPELMRCESCKITPKGCLSRSTAGIRGRSLIVNLPGSEKAARENLLAVIEPIHHGVDMLLSQGSADCGGATGKVLAVCISERKGIQKHPIAQAELVPDHGIVGDAHAGNWHRQISLLSQESVDKIQTKLDFALKPGDFAENILMGGFCLYTLPVGTKMRIGSALCEVTQIGKECHADCAIRKKAGDCVMPREGIFVKVLRHGFVKPGDSICVY